MPPHAADPRDFLIGSLAMLLLAAERLLNVALLPLGVESLPRLVFASVFCGLATALFLLGYLTRRLDGAPNASSTPQR